MVQTLRPSEEASQVLNAEPQLWDLALLDRVLANLSSVFPNEDPVVVLKANPQLLRTLIPIMAKLLANARRLEAAKLRARHAAIGWP